MFFCTYVVSAYAGLFSKKKNSSVLVLNSNYKHFVYSFVAYFAFSSCLRCEDQFCFCFCFFPRGARGHAVVMVNDPFSDLSFFR